MTLVARNECRRCGRSLCENGGGETAPDLVLRPRTPAPAPDCIIESLPGTPSSQRSRSASLRCKTAFGNCRPALPRCRSSSQPHLQLLARAGLLSCVVALHRSEARQLRRDDVLLRRKAGRNRSEADRHRSVDGSFAAGQSCFRAKMACDAAMQACNFREQACSSRMQSCVARKQICFASDPSRDDRELACLRMKMTGSGRVMSWTSQEPVKSSATSP